MEYRELSRKAESGTAELVEDEVPERDIHIYRPPEIAVSQKPLTPAILLFNLEVLCRPECESLQYKQGLRRKNARDEIRKKFG